MARPTTAAAIAGPAAPKANADGQPHAPPIRPHTKIEMLEAMPKLAD